MSRRLIPVLLFCAVALPVARADLWVDPGWGSPLDWARDLWGYEVTEEDAHPYDVGGHGIEETGTLQTDPAELQQPSVPQRIRTADIWGHWRVKQDLAPGHEDGYAVGGGEEAPPVPEEFVDMVLAYYFTRKAFPAQVGRYELKGYLVEIGFPAVLPSICALQDEELQPFAREVLLEIVGDRARSWVDFESAQAGYARFNPFRDVSIPRRDAANLDQLVERIVVQAMVSRYWGQPGFGAALERNPDLLELVLPHVRNMLNDHARILRHQAIGFLRQVRDNPSLPEFVRLLNDKDPVVVRRAWKAVLAAGEEAARDQAEDWLRQSRDPDLVALGIHAMGELGVTERDVQRRIRQLLRERSHEVAALIALVKSDAEGNANERIFRDYSRLLDRAPAPPEQGTPDGDERARSVYLGLIGRAGLAVGGDDELLADMRERFRVFLGVVSGKRFELGPPSNKWPNPEQIEQVWMLLLGLLEPRLDTEWMRLIQDAIRNTSLSPDFRLRLLKKFDLVGDGAAETLAQMVTQASFHPNAGTTASNSTLAAWALYKLYGIDPAKAVEAMNALLGRNGNTELGAADEEEIRKLDGELVEIDRRRPKGNDYQSPEYQEWSRERNGVYARIRQLRQQGQVAAAFREILAVVIAVWEGERDVDAIEAFLFDRNPPASLGVLCLRALQEIDPERATAAFRQLLTEGKAVPGLQAEGLRLLGAAEGATPEDLGVLVDALGHADGEVRFAAYLALRKRYGRDDPFCDWFRASERDLQEAVEGWRGIVAPAEEAPPEGE